jgi:leucyl aminopeptidase
MDFIVKTSLADKGAADAVLAGVYARGELTATAAAIDQASAGAVKAAIKAGDMDGKTGACLSLPGAAGYARVILVGLGERDQATEKSIRDALAAGYRAVKATAAQSVTNALTEALPKDVKPAWLVEQAALLAAESAYRFDQLKSIKPESRKPLAKLAVLVERSAKAHAEEALRTAAGIAQGMNLTKDLGNLPGNHCTPTHLADTAKKLARQHALKVTVLEAKDMQKLGMNTLLAVARGSHEPPKLITLEYNGGKKGAAPLALVGKGITFDTGGISIKPSAEMDEMKYDMCGAGTVLGVMKAVASLKLPVNLVGVIAACENMPGGRATKPGDIVTSMSGQTVEILNTDAEGRLILCDALTYTERFKPAKVVDIATLTGAMVIALGHHTTGVFANNDALASELVKAGNACYDRAWHLPMFAEYDEMLKSNFADIPNITGGRAAGSITAAAFLARFARKFTWAHMDIAGTAWKSGAEKGATGRPVPLLVHWVASHA